MEDQQDYEYFKRFVLELTGIDLHLYKEKQMKRRIDTLIGRKGFPGYSDYIAKLKADPGELDYFTDYITINVTEFFRTQDHWSYFAGTTLQELALKKAGGLRIWSTACATGEEPYSLVMSLAEFLPLDQIRVLATDIDRKVLIQAKRGFYPEKSMEGVPEKLREKYFTKQHSGWQISDDIRKCVEFRRMDLLTEEYPEELDLIVCRNVLIYFTEEAKNQIYHKFRESLAEGGYLFTGNTEQIIQYKNFGYIKKKNFLYQRNSQTAVQGGFGN